MSVDGFEIMMQVNYFAPFLLFDLLNDLFTESSRIINVLHPSYLLAALNIEMDLNMQGRSYDPDIQFSNSKLALALFGEEMSRIHGLRCVNVIPGLLVRSQFYTRSTSLVKRLLWTLAYIIGKNPWQASHSIVSACLLSDKTLGTQPLVMSNCRRSRFWVSSKLRNKNLSKALCSKTVDVLNQCS
eukprot:TRINITY_DN4679_c0_g1_i1.p1 TRINITY_DN4679_c0_g1~~TRINITY_DN4679_c0_g1_i1.p1  ORF type:complete len:185 (-),score=10.82 TRINITY_DN4679_c0_g1_i1:29-583(-)